MASPRPDVVDLLDVPIAPGGTVIAVSDLHLPPERSDVSGRCAEMLRRRLAEAAADGEDLTVVLNGDVVELLSFPGVSATTILEAHADLCAALADVTERGGQVIYTVGNHDGDLAWDLKAAIAVRDLTRAKLCLAADLVMPGGRRVRVEHGHQVDPYNCFHDARNPLDTPLGHHIVREVMPKIEWLGGGWLDGAHEMADPGDFPSFLASRLVYRKLTRHLWWLILLPISLIGVLWLARVVNLRKNYPTGAQWLHDGEILGYGAVVDLAVIALIITIVSRRAWLSISALALAERGYGQNRAARERADALISEGYAGFMSGHTHHPELHAHGDGFYANSGSGTSVVEAIETARGTPPVYLRTQQVSWLELTASMSGFSATLFSARVELPGAANIERFMSAGRNPHSAIPRAVATWPHGPGYPAAGRSLRKIAKRKLAQAKSARRQ
jgi:UDP-2,3-diacylglucosamine pyrophosphatase LpxH